MFPEVSALLSSLRVTDESLGECEPVHSLTENFQQSHPAGQGEPEIEPGPAGSAIAGAPATPAPEAP
jgi:hypothetical protein